MQRTGRSLLAIAAVAAIGTVAPIATDTASAAPAERHTPAVRSAHLGGDTLKSTAQRGDRIDRSGRAGKHVRDYLDQEARRGRMLNEADVSVASVPDPLNPGENVDIAWTGEQPVTDISLQQVDDNGRSGAQAIGVQLLRDGQEQAGIAQPNGGSGYDAASSASNMYKQNNGCVTVWFSNDYSPDQHQLISCFEKWAQSGTNHWVYNRWGLWTRATDYGGHFASTKEFTIRSRPWAGQEPRLTSLNSWQPPGPSSSCQERGSLSLGGTYGGVTGTVSIPMRTCSNTILKNNTSTKMIGIGIEGSEPGRQIRIDVAGDYNAQNNWIIPTWADYAWAQVDFWGGDLYHEYYLNKDSGW
ncbi:hypothetical protein ABT369_39855 [Dactylosporangium sp. NPDC000244]|uniref:hypothetical protein n=1 Tax=Dactylosporangium sp. NPDC000244 TaxID=3154365 RepID=UPI00331DDB50